MEMAAGDIERLPEELLAVVISLTSPPDACRAASVSRTFRTVVDSDAVWSRFLPRNLPQLEESKLAAAPQSKKALFQCLCQKPALLLCLTLTVQLDRVTGEMCYQLAKVLKDEEADEADEADEPPEQCEWITLGCGDVERNRRFESFQSAFWTS